MAIIAICGAIGSGKSFTQLQVGLEFANRKQKQLVTNFPLHLAGLYRYCDYKGYKWLIHLLRSGTGISWFPNPSSLQSLLWPESVCLLDEAGVFLNAREFAKTPAAFLADLAQSRKFGCDLIYCSQFDEQVDKQCRMLTQYFYHCNSLSTYDPKSRRPALRYKRVYLFDADSYRVWRANDKLRKSHIKTRFVHATEYRGGFLTTADKLLFGCFNSFDRLDGSLQMPYLRSRHHCVLPLPSLTTAG